MSNIVDLLGQLGFSEYEAKAYVTLLQQNPLNGYELAKATGLKSGTLYPILIRLADRGLIEASWEDEQPVGRPRRHLYRLTAEGMKQAQQAPVPDLNAPAPRRLAGRRRRLAGDHG